MLTHGRVESPGPWARRLMHVGCGALVLATLATGCERARTGDQNVHDEAIRIVFLGDSLTDGYHLDRAQTYPAAIARLMADRGWSAMVENAGVSGDTSADALQRLGPWLKEPVDLLVVALGINDVFGGVTPAQIGENLQAIIDRTRIRWPAAQFVIVGMELDASWSTDYASGFTSMYRLIAERNQAVLVPSLLEGVAGVAELNLPDGLHPTEGGHEVMTDTVWRYVEPVLVDMMDRR